MATINSKILEVMIHCYPVRSRILSYLKRPSEISRLCVSIGLQLTAIERNALMNPLLEIFPNLPDPKKYKLHPFDELIVMGNNLSSLTNYATNKMEIYITRDVVVFDPTVEDYPAEDLYPFKIELCGSSAYEDVSAQDITHGSIVGDPKTSRVHIRPISLRPYFSLGYYTCSTWSEVTDARQEWIDEGNVEYPNVRKLKCFVYSNTVVGYRDIAAEIVYH